MAVVKYKPLRTARVLDARIQKVHDDTMQAMQRSEAAVGRSKELIDQSKKVIVGRRKRSAE